MTFKILFIISLAFIGSWSKPYVPFDTDEVQRPGPAITSPWHLSLWMDAVNTDICGASLIAAPYMTGESDLALTAAHCLIDGGFEPLNMDRYMNNVFTVVAGNHSLRSPDSMSGEVIVQVSSAIFHPDWSDDKDKSGDLAILKLAKPLKFSDTIQPVALPKQGEVTPSECSISGYGSVWPADSKLQAVEIRLTEKDDCKTNGFGGAHPERFICDVLELFSSRVDNGDSGSALVCKNGDGQAAIYGIVSMTVKGNGRTADIYTRVSAFVDWINEKVSKN